MGLEGKATEEQFNSLHNAVTNELINRVSKGEDCPTADLKAAIEWLHKNNISGVASGGNRLERLQKLVPVVDIDDIRRRVNGPQENYEAR